MFRVSRVVLRGLGFGRRVYDLRVRVWGLRFWVDNLGFGVWGLGFEV